MTSYIYIVYVYCPFAWFSFFVIDTICVPPKAAKIHNTYL